MRGRLAGSSRWTKRGIASSSSESTEVQIQIGFADVLVWLHCSQIASPQLRADPANSLPLRWIPRQAHKQRIRELVACLVVVYVGRDHFGRACVIEFFDEVGRVTFSF